MPKKHILTQWLASYKLKRSHSLTHAALISACFIYAGLGASLYTSTVFAKTTADAPESSTGWKNKTAVSATRHMVVAANPLAAETGRKILRAGGSALDAAIATQLVLALVEPQSSGIGGGAMMLVFDKKQVTAYDGRETAPQNVDENLFLQLDPTTGKKTPLTFDQAVVGGRAVGVPGTIAVLALAHRRHGKLPWKMLFQPAIELAKEGFIISPRLANLLSQAPRLREDPQARAYFYDTQGHPKKAGTRLRNPALAETLQKIANQGPQALYKGKLAIDIVTAVQNHPTNPGRLTTDDLTAYRAKERTAICTPFRQWQVCGMPPPSSGGIAVAQILGILAQQPPLLGNNTLSSQNTPSTQTNSPTPSAEALNTTPSSMPPPQDVTLEQAHYFSEAGRLAFADRDRYVADDDFVPLPGGSWRSLVDPTYLANRAALIKSPGVGSLKKAAPGNPTGALAALASQITDEKRSTTHISIIDANGQAVSLTSSIEAAFGAQIMVDGFLLNNQLTDFSFQAEQDGTPIANRVQAGKRPRSSMSPTLVLEDGKIKMIVGSPGGPNIINYVAKTIAATLDWGYSLQDAISIANIGSRNGPTEVEQFRSSAAFIADLERMGHEVKVREMNSGIHAILRTPKSSTSTNSIWQGMADPRREGYAIGD